MISTSYTSAPRAARAATSFCGAAQPEPTKTRIPLRRCSRAFSAVVQCDELSFCTAGFALFIVAHHHRLNIAFGHAFFGRSHPSDDPTKRRGQTATVTP